MGYVTVAGSRLYYEEAGEGPPLLLAHHAMGSTRSWRRQIPVFAGRFRVIAYNRRGYGQSEGIEAFAEVYLERAVVEMTEFLDALGIEQTHVIGHSDGGTLGLMLAAEYPARVRSLVTEGAHLFYEPIVSPGLARMADQVEHDPEARAWAERNLGAERAVLHAQRFAARWQASFSTLDSLPERIRTIRCPSLHIYGDADPFGSIAQAEQMAAHISGGQTWIIPGGGHTPHEEMPQAFNQRVLEFLSKT